MKRIFLLLISIVFTYLSVFGQYSVTGGQGVPYAFQPDASTGVGMVYLLNTLSGATVSYSTSVIPVRFFKYRNSIADAVEIPASDITSSNEGDLTVYRINNLEDGWGYFAEEAGSMKSPVWIIDYALHKPVLNGISIVENEGEYRCDDLKLVINKEDELQFYSVRGSAIDIDRRYDLEYKTQEWDETNRQFSDKLVSVTNLRVGTDIVLSDVGGIPLQDTEFMFGGDQFGKHFGIITSITSATYQAVAVEPHIIADQIAEDGSVVEETEDEGYSAPLEINFYGFSNEPTTVYYTWFIYSTQDLVNYIARYTDRDITYRFEKSGTFRVVLEVANDKSVCVATDSVQYNIAVSSLKIPNFFSPGNSPGVNDEFVVKHKSLVKFKCTIFNRWGNKITEWTDPDKGWDGTYNGKLVSPGVYFYVIDALGSDGIVYKKGGDINILRSK